MKEVKIDFSDVFNVHSLFIESAPKIGKFTFLSYLITSYYKEPAIIFTPQEHYLFERRITSLQSQYQQFSKLNTLLTPYFLKEDWVRLKQRYGYAFFIQELERIIIHSEENIVVLHRFGEFFEFQDRYEIENVLRALVKIAIVHDKIILYLINTTHENYEYIHNFAEEFSDVLVSISTDTKNHRLIDIKHLLKNQEFPLMEFKITKDAFVLDYYQEEEQSVAQRIKNVLIAELDANDESLEEVCDFILKKPNFNIKHANSLKTILEEIFVRPDMILVFMKRSQENFETIRVIRSQLPNTAIIIILDQKFVRAEDAQEAYKYGCDELFSNDLELENLILALQKASKTTFYSDAIDSLSAIPNIIENVQLMQSFIDECLQKYIFFTLFVFDCKNKKDKISKPSRKHDYVAVLEHKIFYLALNTAPKDVKHIQKRFQECELFCMWEPISHTMIERCFDV